MQLQTELRHAQQRIIFLPLSHFSSLQHIFSYVCQCSLILLPFPLLLSRHISLSPPLQAECGFPSQGPCVSTPLTLGEPCVRLSTGVHVCVCVFSICACKLWALCASVYKSVMCCVVCICQRRICVCVGACECCALLFSLFPCSRAPLNMSDVLERDITTGAEREASSLSSPSPLYITSYWHQSLFIFPSLPPSLSLILSSVSLSLFPVLYFCISLFPFFFSLSSCSSPPVAICRAVCLSQFGSVLCFTDCNTSIVRTP